MSLRIVSATRPHDGEDKGGGMQRANSISIVDRAVYFIDKIVNKFGNNLVALSSGYLMGRVTNELSVETADWAEIVRRLFGLSDRPANVLTWASLIVMIMIPTISRMTASFQVRRKYEVIFAHIIRGHKFSLISKFPGVGWDNNLTLQAHPMLNRGWKIDEILIRHQTNKYSLPAEHEEEYRRYINSQRDKERFFDDKIKVMIIKNPVAFSDSPTLLLETKEVLYSQIRFYQENILRSLPEAERQSKIEQEIERVVKGGQIEFPHSLCLHLIVETKDEKILLTRRSSKVTYYPGAWSCSIEEQLSIEDINSDNPMLKWFERTLNEELGLSRLRDEHGEKRIYNIDNLRILSVFLEGDILSVSLCGYAKLDIDSETLNSLFGAYPRSDEEFSEHAFLEYEELLKELINSGRSERRQQGREYHPTSKYRMLMALIKRYGVPELAKKIAKAKR